MYTEKQRVKEILKKEKKIEEEGKEECQEDKVNTTSNNNVKGFSFTKCKDLL